MYYNEISELKDLYWIFKGQLKSTSNLPLEKHIGVWGEMQCFNSRKERTIYLKKSVFQNKKIPIACTPATARKYHLGMTIKDYINYLKTIAYCSAISNYDHSSEISKNGKFW